MSNQTQKASTKRISKVVIKQEADLQDYGDNTNHFGITAEAELLIPAGMHSHECIETNDARARYECICEGASLVQRITSGGLWGIEYCHGQEYRNEIEQEQLTELAAQLHALGFSKRAVSAAFRNIEREEN